MLALIAMAAGLAVTAPPSTPDGTRPSRESGFDRIMCRVDAPTGSLIPGKKICKTKREWDREAHSLVGYDTRGSCAQAETGSCY